MPKPLPTSIRLTSETKDRLKKFALKRGWALSRLVEFLIQEWLDFQDRAEKKDPWRK